MEIFFVIDTRQKLKNGKTTDQSLQEGNCDTVSLILLVRMMWMTERYVNEIFEMLVTDLLILAIKNPLYL